MKWIGGATLGVLLVLGSAVVADQALEAMVPAKHRVAAPATPDHAPRRCSRA